MNHGIRPPRWGEVTAVFGGRFDPPHLGHREAVRGLFRSPGVGRVLVIPTGFPPHKSPMSPAEHRTAMTSLCFESTPTDPFPYAVQTDLREIKKAQTHPNQPNYSFDTIRELKASHPKLAFVIGVDQLEQLHNWHRFPELLSLCHWIVLERKPDGQERALKTLQEWRESSLVTPGIQSGLWKISGSELSLILVPTEAPCISSTDIRQRITKTGSPPEGVLMPEVLSYLKRHKLYGI